MIHNKTPPYPPFIGRDKKNQKTSYWLVSDNGNFNSGEQTGRLMAQAYINFLEQPGYHPPCLSSIAADICSVQPMSEARKGQLVGFLSLIENQLKPNIYRS